MGRAEQLYHKLKTRIIGFEPGSPFFSVRSIMSDFEVSQVTVSSAIQRLTEEGLLRKNGRRSMEVTETVLRYRNGARPVYCLALPLWPSEYHSMLEERFLELATISGYDLDVLRYDFHDGIPLQLPPSKVDGLIVLATFLSPEKIQHLNSLRVPYLVFGQSITGLPVNSVCHDEEYTGMLAAHHLWELGHRKLAVVHSEPNFSGTLARIKGFRQFAELHDCLVEEIEFNIHSGEIAPEKVYRNMKAFFLKKRPDYTGLFVVSETGAYAICRACREAGLRIPADLSLVTCGEGWHLDYMNPPLTSIGSDHRQLVKEAILLLQATALTGEIEQRTAKADLYPRESTIPCAAKSPQEQQTAVQQHVFI